MIHRIKDTFKTLSQSDAVDQVYRAFLSKYGKFRNPDGGINTQIASKENILLCLFDHDTSKIVAITGKNIVTDNGDRYYATKGAGEAAFFTVAAIRMGSSATAVTKSDIDVTTFVGTAKAPAAGYPKTNDSDVNNTGTAVDSVSWKASWTTAENNVLMQEVAITDSLTVPTKALMHGLFTSFTKTASQAMDVFVNHNMLGI